MKKILLLFAISNFLIFNTFAQFPMGGGFGGGSRKSEQSQMPNMGQNGPKGSAKITGYVIDSAATKAVEFASIALTSKDTKKIVDGAICDDKGKFSLTKVPTGEYILSVSFMGYKTNKIEVKIVDKNDEIDLGVIKLPQSTQLLNEVTVEGQRSLIEDKVDRIVYNAEKDITNKGGDGADVLRKVPSLTVDLDGNVSLRGSSNIKVLINNKSSTIIASSVADALKQIPADMIKSVEVITSPSAKYDAEGSSGIINIITKKTTLQGLTLNFDSSVGIRGGNLSLNGNYRKGGMGFSVGGFGRANYNVNGRFDNTQITTGTDGSKTTNIQGAETRNNGLFGNYQFGWDWDISKTSSISASLKFGARNQTNYQDGLLTQLFKGTATDQPPLNSSTRDVQSVDNSNNVDANVDYTKTFKKPQQELSFSGQFSRNNRTNNFTNTILNPLFIIQNINPSYNQESTLQADYQTPIGKTQLLEFGGKGIFRKVSSTFNQVGNNGSLDYNQNIAASYFSYTLSTKKKYTIKAGARYEYTTIDATQTKEGILSGIGIPSYGVLVPSINISKSLKGGTTLKIAYNRRIQRPSLQFLNPNTNASNPTNVTQGNPFLNPEFTNNYELTVNTFFKNTFLTTALFMRNTTGSIQSVRNATTNAEGKPIILTTYENIGNENAYGMNLFGNVNLSNKLQLGGGTDVFYAVLKNNNPNPVFNASNQGWVISGRIFGSYNLTKGWGIQTFAFYRGNQVQLQGNQGGFGIYSLGLKKDFLNKKGSIGFGAENFFTPNGFTIKNNIESPTISQTGVNTLRNMNFKVTFSYKIGKMTFVDNKKKKKSVNNDDMKDGGDSGGGGQPAAPAGGGGRPRN